jgi:hypothetical protein
MSGKAMLLVLVAGWGVEQAQGGSRIDGASLMPILKGGGSTDALAGILRGMVIRAMPVPLYEASPGWGHQAPAARGVKWTNGKVLPVRPEIMYSDKNQGTWRKIKVTADNVANSLVFDIRDVRPAEPGRLGFTVFVAFDAHLDYRQQIWEAGLRLSDSSVRARFRVKLTLNCEATTRLESNIVFVPELVVRLRVVQSNLQLDNIVVEHIAGLGGQAAKMLGETVQKGIHQWHPSLEKKLVQKANAAIVKAADTKEVRLSLFQLMKKPG